MAPRANAVLVAVLAVLLGIWWSMPSASSDVAPQNDIVPGRNKTILIFSSDMQGTSSAHVAVAFALAQKHPDVSVHYASSPALAPRIAYISAIAANSSSSGRSSDHSSATKDANNSGASPSPPSRISFHTLSGASYRDSVYAATGGSEGLVHAPGLRGTDGFCRCLMSVADMWSEDDHVAQYKSARAVIEALDPSLIVLDVLMGPAAAAARDARRKRAVVSPSTISSYAPSVQPGHAMLWKYPFMASGLSYPMRSPSAIFTNIALTAKMIACIVRIRSLTAEKAPALQARGVESVPDLISSYDPAVPWITQTLPGAHVDLLNIPDNFFFTGPINLEGVAATAGLDPFIEWVRRAPTVLVNMGSMYEFKEPQLRTMAAAIDKFIGDVPGVQILWKAKLAEDIVAERGPGRRDSIAGLLAKLCPQGQEDGRVKITEWLDIEPPTLLREKQLVACVHHGGAGGFSDALSAGVPQIIIPQWTDLYDYATLVEYLGIGLWPCRGISPSWEAECLSSALVEVLTTKGDGGEAGSRGDIMRVNAARFRDQASMNVGRDIAAGEIVRLAST